MKAFLLKVTLMIFKKHFDYLPFLNHIHVKESGNLPCFNEVNMENNTEQKPKYLVFIYNSVCKGGTCCDKECFWVLLVC